MKTDIRAPEIRKPRAPAADSYLWPPLLLPGAGGVGLRERSSLAGRKSARRLKIRGGRRNREGSPESFLAPAAHKPEGVAQPRRAAGIILRDRRS